MGVGGVIFSTLARRKPALHSELKVSTRMYVCMCVCMR